jgi:anti-anti-sigma factor
MSKADADLPTPATDTANRAVIARTPGYRNVEAMLVIDAEVSTGQAPRATGGPGPDGDGRPETSLQRLDRNLEELTGELRVVVTGVQVLFAFLLIVPFNSGFVGVGPFERTVYLVTLLCSAFAALCTIAPAAYHRVLFRSDDKRHVVFVANRVVLVGLVFLALAMCGALLLVTTKLFGAAAGTITAALVGVPFALLWFVAPLLRRTGPGGSAPLSAGEVEHAGAPGGPPWAGVTDPGGPVQPSWRENGVRYDFRVSAQDHLRVDARTEQDRVVLELAGELDLASSPIFEQALEDPALAAAPLVVLDLDGLKFVDSTGLRVILLANESARGRGQEFAITPGSPQVQRLLNITSVAEHMRVIASPDDLLV